MKSAAFHMKSAAFRKTTCKELSPYVSILYGLFKY